MARRVRLAVLLACLVSVPAGPVLAQDGGKPRSAPEVAPSRFGARVPDAAYGAFQRGLYITALNLALPRAKEGDGAAQILVAEIHARGLGVPKNPQEAAKWYGEAAENGVADGELQYALILLEGRHAPKDRERARKLLRSAADKGGALAQFNYAQLLMESSRPADIAEAIANYERAAARGLADAQYAMGIALLDGIGGRKPDRAGARRWLTRAAEQNFDSAQVDLATLLVEARNEKDEKAGFSWMKRAAEAGNVAARNRLAKLYQRAIGTEPDPVMAGAWYLAARRGGLTDAEMENYLDGLTEEQLAEARKKSESL